MSIFKNQKRKINADKIEKIISIWAESQISLPFSTKAGKRELALIIAEELNKL